MLYIAYLPKPKGEHVDQRKVNNILKWHTGLTGDKYSIIVAPGYFSTTESSISSYLNELTTLLTAGGRVELKKRKIGFLNGMNGHYQITNGANTIIEEHNIQISNLKLTRIQLNPKKEFDHRKMMCFFCEDGTDSSEITLDNLDAFLENVYVGAVLIGSSNQSKTTYFDEYAKKGETDVFLIDASDDSRVEHSLENPTYNEQYDLTKLFDENDNVVITKSYFGMGYNKTQDFLKAILREMLTNGLEK